MYLNNRCAILIKNYLYMEDNIMKAKISSFLIKSVANLAYREAKENINSACLFWHYQPPIPKEVVSKLKEKI